MTEITPHPTAILRKHGVVIEEAVANTLTGFVRLKIRMETSPGRARVITAQRSVYGGKTVVMRDIACNVPGMYTDFWTITDHLGQQRFTDPVEGFKETLTYVAENVSAKAKSEVYAALSSLTQPLLGA